MPTPEPVYPSDAVIERIIKCLKERRWMLQKPYHDSGPEDNANVYTAIRRAFDEPVVEDQPKFKFFAKGR